jgi:hypothetical protein
MYSQVVIYDRILDLATYPRFFSTAMNPNSDTALTPVGPNRNQLPLGRNVSFYFSYTQGNNATFLFNIIRSHIFVFQELFTTYTFWNILMEEMCLWPILLFQVGHL